MRPVRLEMAGFGAFRERVEVDFDDTDVFALVGPTGSGKSTVIDAICFALYGSVPRYGREGEVAPAVSIGAQEAKVALTFDAGGTRWIATRVVRRTKQGANTRAARLERVDANGGTEVVVGSVREFPEAIERLIGLRFEHFTKCVVLPQGDFARFLHDTPADRQKLLVKVLDLERYRRLAQAARQREAQHAGQVTLLRQELEDLAAITPETRARAVARLDELVALERELPDALDHDAKLAAAIERARAEATGARGALALLTGVRVPDDVTDLADAVHAAEERLAAAATAASAASDQLERLDVAISDTPDVAALTKALEAHTERAELVDSLARLAAQRTVAADAITDAERNLAAAEEALAAAEVAAEDAVRHGAHADLRAGLAIGEACPVCEQTVSTLPPTISTKAAERVRAQLRQAKRARDDAGKAVLTAQRAFDQHDTTAHEREARVAALDRRIADHPDLDALTELAAATAATMQQHAAAQQEERRCRREHDAATRALGEMQERLDRIGEQFQRQRDPLVSAGLEPPALSSRAGTIDQWRALATWATHAAPAQRERIEHAEHDATAKESERRQRCAHLCERGASAGVDLPRDATVATLVAGIAGARENARRDLAEIDTKLERAEHVRERAGRADRDAQVANLLGRLLDARNFERWIVEEALAGLVDDASAILERMTAGAYSLASGPGSEFLVVDHANADETRSVRTLSGGETFQASLALALALADRVAELASADTSSLESIFLDEGFGTLDPETLDVVAGTIESLGHGERMVGIVTHVPELAERVPVRFRVRKEGRTSVVVREDA